MSKELESLEERLHKLTYVLSYKEINELKSLCYEHGNSWCPLNDFFNDIYYNKSETYNKNQAYKDLWLIALIVLDKKKEIKVLELIKDKRVDITTLMDCRNAEEYNRWVPIRSHYSYRPYEITQEEYDLLKEVL